MKYNNKSKQQNNWKPNPLLQCYFNVRIEISLFRQKIQVIIITNISQIRSCRNKNMIKLFERNKLKFKNQRKPHFVSQPNASICWVKSLVFMVWKIRFKRKKNKTHEFKTRKMVGNQTTLIKQKRTRDTPPLVFEVERLRDNITFSLKGKCKFGNGIGIGIGWKWHTDNHSDSNKG